MKACFFSFLLLIGITKSYSQLDTTIYNDGKEKIVDSENEDIENRFFFGGDFGISAGTYTYIELSPLVGYKITKKWAAGTGIVYQYFSIDDNRNNYHFSTSIYGAKFFSQYNLIQNLNDFLPFEISGLGTVMAYTEYQPLSLERKYFKPNINGFETGRYWINSFYLGFGLKFPIGQFSSLNALILWNLGDRTIFEPQNPILRMSFNI